MDRRGSVPFMVAGLAVSMIGAMGLAVDTTRAWLVEVRLKSAIDAAGLTAARRINEPTRDAETTAVFWANLTQGGRPTTYLGATIGNPVIALEPSNPNRVRVTATATVPTTIFSVIGRRTFTITDSAVGQRSATGVELAIVLDQTASMRATTGGITKLQAAKNAVGTMLDILYAGQDRQPDLYVSVVPFARTINIGSGNTAMLDTLNMPAGWSTATWSGCVEARTGGNDITDAAPTGTARFRPYFWPSTFRQVGSVASGRCVNANAWPAVRVGSSNVRHCHGDNDWRDPDTGARRTAAQMAGNYMYDMLTTEGMTHDQASGPNLLCAQTPILPLTARRTQVNDAITAITAPIRSGGTTTAVGLQGAWYTLAPTWRGHWQDTNVGVANVPALPLDYRRPGMRKVVVMLTDGDNNWQRPYGEDGASCGSTDDRSVCASAANASELMYNAYGRVTTASGGWNARFPSNLISPVSQTNADARLDGRFTATCNAMKATGIIVYIIGFEIPNTTAGNNIRTMLRNCATTTDDHFFESPTAAQLTTVFSQIGNQIASLSLAE